MDSDNEIEWPVDPLPTAEEAQAHKLYWDHFLSSVHPRNFEHESQRKLAAAIHSSLAITRLSAPCDFRFSDQCLADHLAELATPESAALALQSMRRPEGS